MKGLGFNINMLTGRSDEDVARLIASKGKEIKKLFIDKEANGRDGELVFEFSDGSGIALYDDARSCCESRWLHTDDDLKSFIGAAFLDVEVTECKEEDVEYGEMNESSFLKVTTSLGVFTVVAYNHHNGYYGGIFFNIRPFRTDGF